MATRTEIIARLDKKETRFSDEDLSGLDLSKLDFTGCNLHGTNLEKSDLTDSILDNVLLTYGNLRGVDLTNVKADGIDTYKTDKTDMITIGSTIIDKSG